jgi:hypothetical protein
MTVIVNALFTNPVDTNPSGKVEGVRMPAAAKPTSRQPAR